MSSRPKRPPDVPTMPVQLRGEGTREALSSERSTVEKVRLGGQFDEEQADLRGLFYFRPALADRLRSVSAKALGRRLGGGR